MLKEIVEVLFKFNIGIVQMPCPETFYAGLARFWQVRDQYENPGFKKFCRKLALETSSLIEEYLKRGYTVIGVLGVRGSPSCGVKHTNVGNWRGPPREAGQHREVKGSGVFISELKRVLKRKKLGVEFFEVDPKDVVNSARRLELWIENRLKETQ